MKFLAAAFAIFMLSVFMLSAIPAADAYNYGDHHQQGHYHHHHYTGAHHHGAPYAQQR